MATPRKSPHSRVPRSPAGVQLPPVPRSPGAALVLSLQRHIDRELSSLRDPSLTSEARLRVFRSVLVSLAARLPAFEPLLLRISGEYDRFLATLPAPVPVAPTPAGAPFEACLTPTAALNSSGSFRLPKLALAFAQRGQDCPLRVMLRAGTHFPHRAGHRLYLQARMGRRCHATKPRVVSLTDEVVWDEHLDVSVHDWKGCVGPPELELELYDTSELRLEPFSAAILQVEPPFLERWMSAQLHPTEATMWVSLYNSEMLPEGSVQVQFARQLGGGDAQLAVLSPVHGGGDSTDDLSLQDMYSQSPSKVSMENLELRRAVEDLKKYAELFIGEIEAKTAAIARLESCCSELSARVLEAQEAREAAKPEIREASSQVSPRGVTPLPLRTSSQLSIPIGSAPHTPTGSPLHAPIASAPIITLQFLTHPSR
eukprot:RCo016465